MTNGVQKQIIGWMTLWLSRYRMRKTIYSAMGVAIVVVMMMMYCTHHYIPRSPSSDLATGQHQETIHFLDINGYYNAQQNVTSGYETNMTSRWRNIWKHPGLDILNTPKIQFLPNFKNPCWYEPLKESNVYQNNKYAIVSLSARHTMMDLMQTWTNRLAEGSDARRLRCLPYFFFVGQPKCASTDMFRKITKHPDAIGPPIKELHWWSRNRQGRRLNYTDIIPLSQYIDMFDKAALYIEKRHEKTENPDFSYHKIVTGDGSVSVLWENDDWWHFPENQGLQEPKYTNADYIHHVIPTAHIIVSVRNPTDRLYSDYLYFTTANKSAENFHDYVAYAVELYNNCTQHHSVRYCVYNKTIAYQSKVRLRLGMYSTFLKDWFKVFPQEQIIVVTLEEYSKNMKKVMNKLYKFLKLRNLTKEESRQIIKLPKANKRKFKDRKVGAMFNETRKLLDKFYEPYNKELANILQDEKFLWTANYDYEYEK